MPPLSHESIIDDDETMRSERFNNPDYLFHARFALSRDFELLTHSRVSPVCSAGIFNEIIREFSFSQKSEKLGKIEKSFDNVES